MVKTLEKTISSLLRGAGKTFKRYGPAGVLLVSNIMPFTSRNARADELPIPPEEICATAEECFRSGTEAFKAREYRTAGRLFERSCALANDQYSRAILYHNIGVAYESFGDPDNAIVYFRKYGEFDYADFESLKAEAEERGKGEPPNPEDIYIRINYLKKYSQGKKDFKEGRFLDAATIFQGILDIIESYSVPMTKLRVLLDLAQAYEKAGNFELAIDNYDLYAGSSFVSSNERKMIRARILDLEAKMGETILERSLKIPANTPKVQFSRMHPGSMLSASVAAVAGGLGVALNGIASYRYDNSCDNRGCDAGSIGEISNLRLGRNISYGVASVAGVTAVGLFLWESLENKNEDRHSGDLGSRVGLSPRGYIKVLK